MADDFTKIQPRTTTNTDRMQQALDQLLNIPVNLRHPTLKCRVIVLALQKQQDETRYMYGYNSHPKR